MSSRISTWTSVLFFALFTFTSCYRSGTTKTIRIDLHARPSQKFAQPLNSPYVLSRFGHRSGSYHTGVDLKGRGKNALAVLASRDGRVMKTGWIRGYGNVIEIVHNDKFSTRYAHLKKISVKLGQNVKAGKAIGVVGATGRASGPHLHFEIMTPEKRFTDPCLLIKCEGK